MMMPARRNKIALLLLLAALLVVFFALDLPRELTLEAFKANRQNFQHLYALRPGLTLAIYFLLYVAVAALSLPGAAVLTLAGGALFGFWPALAVVSFASSIGATLAFLTSCFLLRAAVQKRFGERLRAIDAGVAREGAFYLFSLRLVPLFPFFIINLLLGLTPMRTRTFYWVSQVGMLPGTAVFVNAGIQLGRIESLAGILSPGLLFAFALLGLFPLFARKLVSWMQIRRGARRSAAGLNTAAALTQDESD
jgi:uncharacterized membrane protein YdjX (TVP38/TMEM64 family)